MSKKIPEISECERWLFAPENKATLEKVKKVLQEDANNDLGSFTKYAGNSKNENVKLNSLYK